MSKESKNKVSFSERFPNVAKEWHPSKNKPLAPNSVTPFSQKIVWWRCKKGHEWEADIASRSQGWKTCEICKTKEKVSKLKNYNLETEFPNIAKEWHPSKNGSAKPSDFSPKNQTFVWWQCKNGHEWNQKISRRTSKNQQCKSCKSIVYSYPEIAKEWHPIKNGNKNVLNYSHGSEEKVWWIDDEGYEWESSCYQRVSSKNKSLLNPSRANKDFHSLVRVNKNNQLSKHFPKLVKEWNPKNERGPETYTIKSGQSVWWLCENGHEWEAPIHHRTGGTNCPYCSKSSTSRPELRILSELRTIFNFEIRLREKIFKKEIDVFIPKYRFGIEYDGIYYHKNKYKKDKEKSEFLNQKDIFLIRIRVKGLKKISTKDIIVNDGDLNKEDLNSILLSLNSVLNKDEKMKTDNYIQKDDFVGDKLFNLYLSYFPKPLPEESLLGRFPNIAKEWNYKRNSPLVPEGFRPFSHQKVWWICPNGREYEYAISNRTNLGRGCRYCKNKKIRIGEENPCIDLKTPL